MVITLLAYVCFMAFCFFVVSMCIGYSKAGVSEPIRKSSRTMALVSSFVAIVSFIIIIYLIDNQ